MNDRILNITRLNLKFYISASLVISLIVFPLHAFAHGSGNVHIAEMYSVLPFKALPNGAATAENRSVSELLGMITSDLIDNYWGKECEEFGGKNFYNYLRDEFGFRCKHRLLFHWGFNARPWTDELEKKISKYAWYSDSKTVERFKQTFIIEQARRNRQANEWTERTFGFISSGKESSWANGMIALMYDVHLLGDWEPDDNSDFDGVTPPSKIAGDIVNVLRRIDASRSRQIERALSDITKSSEDECTMAVQMINILQEMLPSFLLTANDGALKKKFEKNGFTLK